MQKTWRSTTLVAYTLAILAFLYLPLVILTLYSFNDSRINAVWAGFTLKWYASLLSNDRVLEALTNSLLIASITTVVTTIMGTLAAIALHRYQYRSKTVLNSLLYLPILIPEIVMGLSLLILFSQLGLSLGKPSLIVAHITFCLSFVIITVGARLEGSRQDIEETASDLYATPLQTFRYVTLPMIAPGIIAGALMAFTLSIDDFVISFFVAGPDSTTLPLYIYAMVKRGISPQINALSTCMMLVTVSLVVVSQLLQMKSLHATRKE
ncbi:MAG: ABC transporter permease [Acidaminococcus intestini]|uniref:ABC transporter permease n=1 Tax=Acidaminococcus intestini TaxID=187327 RepID=A0A943ECX5_9FIRM|nr:ABC transporter permease [Acidaminococcus intestini]